MAKSLAGRRGYTSTAKREGKLMKTRFFAILLLALTPILSVSALSASKVEAAKATKTSAKGATTQVSGKFSGSASGLKGPGTFTGTLQVKHFVVENHRLVAKGTITGTLKDATGKTKQVSEAFSAPIQGINQNQARTESLVSNSRALQTSCSILTLNIGAIHLNLLGLVVDLAPVNLTITGQTGPGNLLGNLLCGIAGLLNGLNLNGLAATLLQDIALLLNQALGSLGGL